jgi:hypothetical protein
MLTWLWVLTLGIDVCDLLCIEADIR